MTGPTSSPEHNNRRRYNGRRAVCHQPWAFWTSCFKTTCGCYTRELNMLTFMWTSQQVRPQVRQATSTSLVKGWLNATLTLPSRRILEKKRTDFNILLAHGKRNIRDSSANDPGEGDFWSVFQWFEVQPVLPSCPIYSHLCHAGIRILTTNGAACQKKKSAPNFHWSGWRTWHKLSQSSDEAKENKTMFLWLSQVIKKTRRKMSLEEEEVWNVNHMNRWGGHNAKCRTTSKASKILQMCTQDMHWK